MAARATRSASRNARRTEAVATGPLGALSHDELGVIVDGLADPLQPVVAVALSSTCLGLRTPLKAALEVLKERHARAAALGRKSVRMVNLWDNDSVICAELRDRTQLTWQCRSLTADDMTTLGLILHWMPRLTHLTMHACWCNSYSISDAYMHVLCEGLGRGAAPSLRFLGWSENHFGPVGAMALAAALRRGALPNFEELHISDNPLGNEGAAALAPALKKLPALKVLDLGNDGIGDEGLASLLDNLGKDDFKKLTRLYLDGNLSTDKGCATIVAALKAGALPALKACELISDEMHASEEACAAVKAALQQRLG